MGDDGSLLSFLILSMEEYQDGCYCWLNFWLAIIQQLNVSVSLRFINGYYLAKFETTLAASNPAYVTRSEFKIRAFSEKCVIVRDQ